MAGIRVNLTRDTSVVLIYEEVARAVERPPERPPVGAPPAAPPAPPEAADLVKVGAVIAALAVLLFAVSRR